MPELQKLVILHTNDIHSHFERMPKIAAVIKQIRRRYTSEQVISVDCGDHMDRIRLETEFSEGRANAEVINTTGYDVLVPGNREGLTFTPDILNSLYVEHVQARVVCSNLMRAKTKKQPPWINPYLIINKGLLRIGIVGLTTDLIKFYTPLGWVVRDPLTAAAEWVRYLRPKTHIVVVVSHLGLQQDQRIAKEITGIDIIIGGHSHDLLESPLEINGTYVCSAGKYGEHVGMIQLEYDIHENLLTNVSGHCIKTGEYRADEQTEQIAVRYQNQAKKEMSVPIAELDSPLPIAWNAESPLGNLLAAGVRRITGAEVGLVNAGQFIAGLNSGAVSRIQLLRACPSPASPCRIILTGKQLHKALEESLLDEVTQQPINGFNFSGKVVGMLCVDGMQVHYNMNQKPYQKIKNVLINGCPLRLEQMYAVGALDIFTFGLCYPTLGAGKELQYFPGELMRRILELQLETGGEIENSRKIRWLSIAGRKG